MLNLTAINASVVRILIADPEMATMIVCSQVSKFARLCTVKEFEVQDVPLSVVQYCLQIERQVRQGKA